MTVYGLAGCPRLLGFADLPQKPSCMIIRSGGFERVYVVYLYVKHPEDVFALRPKITEEVFRRWDAERAKTKSS